MTGDNGISNNILDILTYKNKLFVSNKLLEARFVI